jgi:signal transduction histidine kinase
MRDRLTLVFGALVTVPVVLLALLGGKVARDEQAMVAQRLEALREDRLGAVAAEVRRTVEAVERELGGALLEAEVEDQEALRDLVRALPLVTQVFVQSNRGELRFPREDGATDGERAFLARTQAIWKGRAILYEPPAAEGTPRRGSGSETISRLALRRGQGWVNWYWAEGLHLMFWRALPTGEVIGAEVDRIGLLSRVVGELPELDVLGGRVALVDARGDALYQWGPAEPVAGERPEVQRALDYPLESFALGDYRGGPAPLIGSTELGMYGSVTAAIVVVLLLAVYFHRERTRELREAQQRVGFVTQVSHELKTPLTNIRLYAELLAEELPDEDVDDAPARRHLGVIVSESQRLSRLIHNILTFSKRAHDKVELSRRPLGLRPLVEDVVAQFRPSFQAKDLEVDVVGSAERVVVADADALGQVLGNLLSNVEKYAADSQRVEVTLTQDERHTRVSVRDFGQGIPASQHERVFEPFVRLGDRLSDGTGTGIGLTIARELVRRHGGELTLEDARPGARFVITLPATPEVQL